MSVPSPIATWTGLNEIDGASFVIEEHRHYLSDHVRTRAFVRAIETLLPPGGVYADLGCGTGFLSVAACRAGARRVFAVDSGDVIHVAREIARANGCADRITFIQAASFDTMLDEPADLVSFEFISAGGVSATLVSALCDARDRWLKPGGRLIPGRLRPHVAIVAAPDEYARRIDGWNAPAAGFDVSAGRQQAIEEITWLYTSPDALRSAWGPVVEVDLHTVTPAIVRGAATLRVTRGGLAHGIASCFHADLAPGVTITNDPAAAEASTRPLCFVPFAEALDLAVGDAIEVEVFDHIRHFTTVYRLTWHRRAGLRHRTEVARFRGMPIGGSILRRLRPDARPSLTPAGEATLTALSAAADGLSSGDLSDRLIARHPDVLADAATARVFGAQALRRAARQD